MDVKGTIIINAHSFEVSSFEYGYQIYSKEDDFSISANTLAELFEELESYF